MATATNTSSRKIIPLLLAALLFWTESSMAVEAPGSPFTVTVTTNTARTYEGTVTAGQTTLVAYERDILVSTSCSSQNTLLSDFSLSTPANQGTVDFSGVTLTGITIQPWEDLACSSWVPPEEARAIYYTADTTATGTDSFIITITGGDTITVLVTIAPATSGVATVTPALLQSSVKQTTSMISSRIKRVIIPHTLFKERSTDSPTHESNLVPKPEQTARRLSDIIKVSVSNDTIGLSAGDASMRHGIWTNIAYTSADNDNSATESSMDINSYIIGYDYKLSERMAMGVAVTYEQVDADLDFNNGDLDGDGYTMAPYFAMLLTDYLAMDIIAGYGIVDYDQNRDFGATKSSVDAERQFVQFSINGFHYIEQWSFNTNLNFLYAHESQDSYIESDGTRVKSNNVEFSQLSVGLEVAYGFKYVEPYFTVAYEYDTQYDEISGANYDRNGGDGGLGCRLFFSDQLSGDMYGSTKLGRDDYDEYSILGNLRYDF